MKVKRTPDEVIITLPASVSENDLLDVISFLKNKFPLRIPSTPQSHQTRMTSGEYNWWKENQLLL